jgi:hypothetical protein
LKKGVLNDVQSVQQRKLKIGIITALLCVFSIECYYAQSQREAIDPRPLRNLNLNIWGDASLISLNFERQYIIEEGLILSGKIGLGYNQELSFFSNSTDQFFTIPHHITMNGGEGRHFVELGLGGTLIGGANSQPYLFYPILGYRFLPLRSKKMNFRIFGHIPFTGLDTEEIYFVPFGINVGYSF